MPSNVQLKFNQSSYLNINNLILDRKKNKIVYSDVSKYLERQLMRYLTIRKRKVKKKSWK